MGRLAVAKASTYGHVCVCVYVCHSVKAHVPMSAIQKLGRVQLETIAHGKPMARANLQSPSCLILVFPMQISLTANGKSNNLTLRRSYPVLSLLVVESHAPRAAATIAKGNQGDRSNNNAMLDGKKDSWKQCKGEVISKGLLLSLMQNPGDDH